MTTEKLFPIPREEVLKLAPFEGLGLAHIAMPIGASDLVTARDVLLGSPFLGFDTEVKPTFTSGEAMRGPDVVQFSTGTRAFVFQMHRPDSEALVRDVLLAPHVVKVGFDLRSDQKQLMHRLGVHAQPLLDLDFVFHARGYPKSIGVKAAIALLFNRRLLKSKRVTTSNWANHALEPRQVLYAANDAYAAWAVLDALGLSVEELPIWANGLSMAPSGS
jgi:ribonuclease D